MPSQHIKSDNWELIKKYEMEATAARNEITKASDLMNLILKKELKEIKETSKSEREIYFKEL